MDDLVAILADYRGRGFVIAPAGFGKTHLIAQSVGAAKERQLVLTHTYAGVSSIREKLAKLGVDSRLYHVDTIASWALRLCLAYPSCSGWRIQLPEGDDWSNLYTCCSAFLRKSFVQLILNSSYQGVYVDEYQDCSRSQHDLVVSLSNILTVRVLGDPLQAIFDFAEKPVDWQSQVYPYFESLGKLETPWRWLNAGRTDVGEWLRRLRDKIEDNHAIDLMGDFPQTIRIHIVPDDDERRNKQINVCKYIAANRGEVAIAIHAGDGRGKQRCHTLAKMTSGRFSSIEEVEGKRLFKWARKLDERRSPKSILLETIDCLGTVMSYLSASLASGTKRGEIVKIGKNTKNQEVVVCANDFLQSGRAEDLMRFALAVGHAEGVKLYGRDLFNRFIGVLRTMDSGGCDSFLRAVEEYQRTFRFAGRPLKWSRLVGTTLLVKGLEFDHCVVLEASELSKKELYVALTRGCKSITIISKKDS